MDIRNKPTELADDNRFRGEMKETTEEFFAEVIKLLIKNRYIRMENYFIDGTKIKTNANKYTFVRKKSIRYDERELDKKIRKHPEGIEILEQEEQEIYQEEDLEEDRDRERSRLTAAQVEQAAVIDKKIEEEPQNKELKKREKYSAQTLS